MNRRNFLINKLKATGAMALLPSQSIVFGQFENHIKYKSQRPSPDERTFTSDTVEELINEVKANISDPELAWMFENCYPNTLDTTVDYEIIDGKPDTFIITGDIDAMWLRDSTAQVWPYMPLIKKDPKIKNLILGLINRQVKCVLTDPYANAFYKDLKKRSIYAGDLPNPEPGVHERKWEIDSLCYVIRLSYHYYKITGDSSPFDAHWDAAMRLIFKTFRTEQRKNGSSPYTFVRKGTAMIDAPIFSGTGRPIKPTGLICSMFRPSDDATLYPYLIPSNIFAQISLSQLKEIYTGATIDVSFAKECDDFSIEVKEAVTEHAIKEHLDFGSIYAYEVDGFGNSVFMDDANVPSLLSLAYIGGHQPTDPIYKNTRKFVTSYSNPYFLKGKDAEGQASPHTGKDRIWPMGIILRGITSIDENEILRCISMLKATHADTGFMHEAFQKDNPFDFYRSWFAWANTLFGEFIIKVYNENPKLLKV